MKKPAESPGSAVAGIFQRVRLSQWIVPVLVFISLNLVLLSNLLPKPVEISEGQVAKRDVAAPRRVTNRYQTDLLREEAAKAAVREAATLPGNYEINQALAINAEELVGNVFRALRGDAVQTGTYGDAVAVPAFGNVDEARQYLKATLGIEMPNDALQGGLDLPKERLMQLEAEARQMVSDLMRTERIDEENVTMVREAAEERVAVLEYPPAEHRLLVSAVTGVIRPNLVLDPQKVERAREQAMRAVRPVYVEQGQMIVRKGDIVQPEHVMILRDLGLLGQRMNYATVMGVATIVLMLMLMMAVYVYQFHRPLLQNQSAMALLGLTLLVVSGLAKVAGVIPMEGAGFLIPTAVAGVLITVLLDSRLAVMSVIFLTVIVGLVMGQGVTYVFVALSGGLASVFSVSRLSQRNEVTRAGLIVGLANFVTMIAMGLFRSEWALVKFSVLGVVNGVISAVLAIGLLPYLESVFGMTSAIRLLELSNPNHPLLRKLLMEAPGSYHHSMIVANLAETAAEAIGADTLLTRVQALYHDVGKIRRPYFFIENQYALENPHEQMKPSLSALVIISHIKDGMELARQYRLPQVIIDAIPEHHGTGLVRYFYHKAVEQAEGEAVVEADYHYPGPRPQTKETAIVMLADSVEAAVRSLARPTPGRIEAITRKIIKERHNDGQLDESDITFKDLGKIAEAFVRVLTGIFHNRIAYPEMPGGQLSHSEQRG
ncbi:MAG: HD family phosphohydrolase [Limnochordia bacterium]|jgi:putative nucleotidyltransferase with HDIG domain